jgi:putative transcriptional regulator
MELVCLLEKLIEDRGLKKGYVAEKAEISKATLTALMKNRSLPTLPVAFKIGDVMGMKIEDIWKVKK